MKKMRKGKHYHGSQLKTHKVTFSSQLWHNKNYVHLVA